jgi:radical SAM protein with 4Fe4S-binding SPASM domain
VTHVGGFAGAANRVINAVEMRLGATKLVSKPVVVDVVLTKACNLACTFCRDYETEGAQRISLENFQKVVRHLFPAARQLSICSGGEPYLHTGLEQILRSAKQYKIFTWVLSNGMLMPANRVRTIVSEELVSSHGFSVDGYEDATVEAIRIRAKLPLILANIEQLIRIRGEMGKTKPRITVRYALMRMNIEELPKAVERWGKMGIDNLICAYLAIANGIDHNESLFFHQELTERIFQDAKAVAARYPSLKLNLPELVPDQVRYQSAPKRCTEPWHFVGIDTNGNLLPCYRAFEALAMGNIYRNEIANFTDVWNSPAYQSLRATVNNDNGKKFYPYCACCENRLGWGAVGPHLGDESWIEAVNQDREDLIQIDHRRSKPKYHLGEHRPKKDTPAAGK